MLKETSYWCCLDHIPQLAIQLGRKEGKAVLLPETIYCYIVIIGARAYSMKWNGSSIKHGTEKIKHEREIFNNINKVNVAVL